MKQIKAKDKDKLKIKNNNKEKTIDKIYNFDECNEKLYFEIKNFKSKHFKKDSNKSFKTIYFTKYIESLDYTLNNSKITFLQSKHLFLKQFLSELEIYPEYDEPIKKIIEVLCGISQILKKFIKC